MVWQHNKCALSYGRPRPPMHRDFNALRRKFLTRGQSSLCMLAESAFEGRRLSAIHLRENQIQEDVL
jgi:hypothetical protein